MVDKVEEIISKAMEKMKEYTDKYPGKWFIYSETGEVTIIDNYNDIFKFIRDKKDGKIYVVLELPIPEEVTESEEEEK